MLDLKLLEIKLDEALAKETTESLTDWLNAKRVYNTLLSKFENGDMGWFQKVLKK